MKKSFNEIAGYENEKKELCNICKLIKNYQKIQNTGFRLPKGILLMGKPGVGKTAMAETIIQESEINSVRVDYDSVDEDELSEYLDERFKEAIKNGPSIIFIDELDKFCGESSAFLGKSNVENSRKILKAINDNQSDNIMLLATANDIKMIQPAIRRSGRFDRIFEIPLPNFEDRKRIIEHYTKKIKVDKKVNFDTLAKIMCSLSGADIECVINEAGLNAILNERDIVNQYDFDIALNRAIFKSSEKNISKNSKRNEIVAVHEVGHLLAGLILNKDNVGSVSIIPQGKSEGHTKISPENEELTSLEAMLNNIVIELAGKAAEKIFFPDENYLSSGEDIAQAYNIARGLVTEECCFGIDFYVQPAESFFDIQSVSNEKIKKIETKCDEIVNLCMEKARKIISENYDIAVTLIEVLKKKFSLSREEIMKIYNKASLKIQTVSCQL